MLTDFERSIFTRLSRNPILHPAVKLWYMMFKLMITFDNVLSVHQIRDSYAWTLDEDGFIAEVGGRDFADSIRMSNCVNCNYPISGDYIREVRGTCGRCNSSVFGNVPSEEKMSSWFSVNGMVKDAPCFCCLTPISSDSFSAAHVRAAKFRGPPVSYNIRPTCFSCNDAMGTTNLTIFQVEIDRISRMLIKYPYLMDVVITRWEETIDQFGIPRG
jgi:hypothetical protein